MAITLTADEYDEIRLLVGNDIDDDELTDDQIDGETVLGAAERYMLTRVPNGESGLDTQGLAAYRSGVMIRCAIILVPSYPEQIQETTGQISSRYQGTSAADKIELLEAQLAESLQVLIDGGHGSTVSTTDVDGFFLPI